MAKKLYEIENKKRNNKIVNVIKTGLSDLKDKIKGMSKHEKKIENKNIKNIKNCWKIIKFNKQNQKD